MKTTCLLPNLVWPSFWVSLLLARSLSDLWKVCPLKDPALLASTWLTTNLLFLPGSCWHWPSHRHELASRKLSLPAVLRASLQKDQGSLLAPCEFTRHIWTLRPGDSTT